MRIRVLWAAAILVGFPAVFWWYDTLARSRDAAVAQDVKRERPVGAGSQGAGSQGAGPEQPKAEQPKDGMVYVWSLPNTGHQSLIVLHVVDGNTVDAAFLVPVRVRLKGAAAPALTAKGGKEAREAVDKLLGGQLRTAQLFGASQDGVLADFWIAPDKAGDKGKWSSAVLSGE